MMDWPLKFQINKNASITFSRIKSSGLVTELILPLARRSTYCTKKANGDYSVCTDLTLKKVTFGMTAFSIHGRVAGVSIVVQMKRSTVEELNLMLPVHPY